MNHIRITGIVILTIFNTACSVFGVRSEETPMYEVIAVEDDKEIRKYKSYIVAKTTVSGDYDESQNKAFRILADYIFGKNSDASSIAMTAPVIQSKPQQGTTIAMTAPVVQEKGEQGWTMSFMMPSKYTWETLPKPVDERVELEQVPERYIAAIKYSWGRGEKRNQTKADQLVDWLKAELGYEPVSSPMSAGYDPPWTLPFFRRNEMHVEVRPSPKN